MLNSKLLGYIFKIFYGTELSSRATRYKKVYIEQLPIPKIPENDQQPFIDLVDQILAITQDADYLQNATKQAHVSNLEKGIDQLIYKLYNLTSEEIKIIESNSK